MMHTRMKRYFGAELAAETRVKKTSSAELPDQEEQAMYLEKVRKFEEFHLSHLPGQPVYGRPSTFDASHRFGKREGST